MRLAFVNREHCKAGVDCNYICMSVCPVNRSKKDCITIAPDKKVVIDEKLCIGCGICVKRCPFNAISIINLPEELDKPIHRFGKNGFALYNLTIPIFGKVVGVLGKNGIGKSTSIKILAGVLKPNFGRGMEATYEELIDFFKGTEAQKFFEEVRDKKIRISYKPQNIDLIPLKYKGNVRKLLERVDEKNMLDEVVKELQLNNFIDRNIDELSGGELQRVAIAATVLKDAEVYIFDEPTSYLDIKQRINVAKFIRKLANQKTAVIVVEHDLLVLDFMSDLVYVMYGKPSCYGIVSMLKSTRQAINEYLQGYLKEENMRIRSKPISFEEKPPSTVERTTVLTSWSNVVKRLGNFELKAESGKLYNHQVVGVLGENGIGKTTFVKILAGIIKPDSGSFDKVKVSYKPQYLSESVEKLNGKLVSEIISVKEDELSIQVIRDLNIKSLMLKKVNELSGGELQRVAIADCLTREAQLYLLDEPSAYLDVEDRMIVAKTIANFMAKSGKTALVVDHDLLFIDSVSEALLVFDGKASVKGIVNGPLSMEEGMNKFLEMLDITLRRDLETKRPRINKEGSKKDREQKSLKKYYYS